MHASTSSSAVSRAVTTAPAARRGPLASHASGAARSQRASTSSALSLRHPRGPRRRDAAVHLARARNAGERAPEEDRGDEYYDYSYDPRDARTRGSRDGGYYDGGYDDGGYYDGGPRAPSSSDDYERQAPPGGPPPDVTLLTQREIQSLLPIGATGEQYAYFWGGPETAVQRLGLSLVGLVATVNLTALLAVPTATFFLWAPVALAARRNSAARAGRNIGLWRARVLAVATRDAAPGPGYFDERFGGRTPGSDGGYRGADGNFGNFGNRRDVSRETWMLSLLVGDYSGARVELRVPLQRQHAKIREGDEVEMVVGSDESYFARFEAVREAYFPRTNTWVGEYPFLDRRAMPAISGRIARDREAWAARDRDGAAEY